MARTPSAFRLSSGEAADFRKFIRSVRDAKGLTNESIADALRWEPDRVANLLKSGRPLLAEKAYKLYEAAVRKLKPYSRTAAEFTLPFVTNKPPWFRSYESSQSLPPVLIPKAAVNNFVDLLANEVARAPHIGKASLRELRRALERVLRKNGPDMASTWSEVTGMGIHRLITDIQSGDVSWDDTSIDQLFGSTPTYFAREVVAMAAAIGFPKEAQK